MVSGFLKSRRLKKVMVKSPSGSTLTHYTRRNRNIVKCAITKKPLRGIPRLVDSKFKNLNKSKKTVSRAFGGYMSHIALKEKILNEMIINK